ncbi:MAG: hypothetical protein K2P78_04125 [Gemmataceae bacterium]|nr:hypothetical protein [Gemmataceae bacterium]
MDLSAAKAAFFDRPKVKNAVDKATKQALSEFGAFVRTRSRSSIRKRKKISPAGSPPSSHVGTLKRLIFFGYDPGRKSVVIGPVVGGPASGAPPLLEYGGSGKAGHYRPRPFMGPAFATELPQAAPNFKALIR